jgi:hypothetical protein
MSIPSAHTGTTGPLGPPGREGNAADRTRQAAEIDRLRAEVADLRRAMDSYPVIDQARGMVMILGRCTPEDAWEVLVEVSQHTNTKLRAVAAHLVASAAGDTLPEPTRRALCAALHRRRRGPT